ncbi:hypothetical protein DPMN_180616 [Dreissena polymorpha]|uniref:Vertnin n=1 Tax=Dreissena polymorpha TaxID=45954 RepID=A0A9D4INE6_DREPO|nr:hypothetical protein DPMN_180616 [Dreissena polymorpha]
MGGHKSLDQAKTESKLLLAYKVELPVNENLMFSASDVDKEAVKLLRIYQPEMNADFCPVTTIGDGNCLYQTVSKALTGVEDYHVLIRLKTAIEMILNRSSYDTGLPKNDFLNEFAISTSPYAELVQRALTVYAWSEMAHLYAISAALKQPIQSYFPPQQLREMSDAYTRTVLGRNVDQSLHPKATVMWSSKRAPKYRIDFKCNHFVPLVSLAHCSDVSGLANCEPMDIPFSRDLATDNNNPCEKDKLNDASCITVVSDVSDMSTCTSLWTTHKTFKTDFRIKGVSFPTTVVFGTQEAVLHRNPTFCEMEMKVESKFI